MGKLYAFNEQERAAYLGVKRITHGKGKQIRPRKKWSRKGTGGGGGTAALAWYVAVTDIPRATTVAHAGVTYRIAQRGDVIPWHWPAEKPANFPWPPTNNDGAILMALSANVEEIRPAYNYYSTDILGGSRVLCATIDGILWVVTEDCT